MPRLFPLLKALGEGALSTISHLSVHSIWLSNEWDKVISTFQLERSKTDLTEEPRINISCIDNSGDRVEQSTFQKEADFMTG